MKNILLVNILLLTALCGYTQNNLFEEVSISSTRLNALETQKYYKFSGDKMVRESKIIKVNFEQLKENSFDISVNGKKLIAQKKQVKEISKSDFSWFGQSSDGMGIFFTVMGKKMASKFYLDNIPYTIFPLNEEYHMLIAYDKTIDEGKCGTTGETLTKKSTGNQIQPSPGTQANETILLNENLCRMRVLLVVTAEAELEIPMSLDLAARMLEDESNLAYQQSQINYRMEIARVVRTNYTETTTNQNSTEYGVNMDYPLDLLNLRSGTGLLNNIPTLRNNYSADVVILIRSAATNAAQGFYGAALGVPTGAFTPNANNAFAIISTEYMIGGRYTFAHEIGHIQGARHDDDNRTPVYARGYVYTTHSSTNRTIMATGRVSPCLNAPTGCRVQNFSNPNISFFIPPPYAPVPMGVANQYDNARRINETANNILNFRTTSATLLLPAETFDAEILARHIATTSISTNNNNIIAFAQSRVSFRAENEIRLLPGFEARSGSEFLAYIGDCANAPQLKLTNKSDNFNDIMSEKIVASPDKSEDDKNLINIYPNPSTGLIYITGNTTILNNSIITVTDHLGRQLSKIKNNSGNNIKIINLSKVPNGIYYIQIKHPSEIITRKIVIQK